MNDGVTNKAVDSTDLIDTLRWHTVRYDNLRASVASRASFILGADAFLVAGIAVLMPTAGRLQLTGGAASSILLGACGLATILCVSMSALDATRTFTSPHGWREILGNAPAKALFYQHSDTVKELSTYSDFRAEFLGQRIDDEIERAVINLWMMIRTHSTRYASLRRATQWMRRGILAFLISITLLVVLGTVTI